MAKPRTKGDTIGVQLPLAVDAVIRERAEAARLSPGLYIADRLAKSITAATPPRPPAGTHAAGPKRTEG